MARGNPAQVALRLSELADELDDVNVRRERLMDERVALWKKGKTLGMNATDLGKVSRVQAVTVRQRLMKESANA